MALSSCRILGSTALSFGEKGGDEDGWTGGKKRIQTQRRKGGSVGTVLGQRLLLGAGLSILTQAGRCLLQETDRTQDLERKEH